MHTMHWPPRLIKMTFSILPKVIYFGLVLASEVFFRLERHLMHFFQKYVSWQVVNYKENCIPVSVIFLNLGHKIKELGCELALCSGWSGDTTRILYIRPIIVLA